MSARPQAPLRPYGTGQSAAMEFTRWRLDGDRGEDRDCRSDATGSVRVPGCRRQDGPTGGVACWLSASTRSPPADITGKTWKPFEASTAPVAAAVPSPPRGGGGAQAA